MNKFDAIMNLIAKMDVSESGRNVDFSKYTNEESKRVEYDFSFRNLSETPAYPTVEFRISKTGSKYGFNINYVPDEDMKDSDLKVIFEEIERVYGEYLHAKLVEYWGTLGVYIV